MSAVYAYYRSTLYGTAIEKVLQGAVSGPSEVDVILVKGSSLEHYIKQPIDANDDASILVRQFEQPVFGLVNDIRLIRFHWDTENSSEINMDVDETKKREILQSPYTFRARSDHPTIVGNDVIAAVSEYGKLVFWTIRSFETADQKPGKRFETLAEVMLEKPGLEYTKIGKKLAVDPYSRALAVASYQDRFDIFILNQRASRTSFDPFVGMGSVTEEGILWHMEFLHTEHATPDRIVLCTVVYNDIERLCRVIVYIIDASNPDDVIVRRIGRLPLERNTPLPVLLIPLAFKPETMLLVTEQYISVFNTDDVASGNVHYPTSLIPRPFGELDCPLITSFALLPEPQEHLIYLGSAEGQMFRVDLSDLDDISWEWFAGSNPIGQAMCALGTIQMMDDDNVIPADVLFYVGESADSQVIAIAQYGTQTPFPEPIIMQTMTNRAPLSNATIAPSMEGAQDALIACSGQHGGGSLSFITNGISADLIEPFDSGCRGITQMWGFPISPNTDRNGKSYLLLMSGLYTKALSFKAGYIRDCEHELWIQHGQKTLFADIINIHDHKVLCQICPGSIRWILVENHVSENEPCNGNLLLEWKPQTINSGFDDRSILFGTAYHTFDHSFQVALCLRRGMRNELCVFDVEFDMHHGSLHMHPVAQIVLEEEPSYLGYLNCCESSVIAVGTFTATLYLYTLHKQQLRAPKVIAYDAADGPLSIPQSAAVIGNGDISYFLLGLREGTLLAFKWHNNEKVPLFNDPPLRYHLGALPVRLTSASVPSSVYALSEYVWRIDVGSQDELVMSLVLLPKPRNMIDAITVIPHVTAHPRDHGIGTNEDHLFLSTRNEISIYKLGQTRQLHSRKLTINETPRKVVYNESLQHAVLMSTSSTTTEYKPLLRIVDLASGLPTTCRKPHNLLTDNINPDDTVLCMKEWSVHRNHKIYNYLCMGMSRSKGNQSFGDGRKLPSTQEGTLLIYRIMVDRTFRLVWMESNLPGAVHAVCPHPSGLLFSSGSLLHLFRLDPAQGRMVQVASKRLRFLITAIHVTGDRICVASHTDSISFYHFDPDSGKIEFRKSDTVSRTIRHTMLLNGGMAVGSCMSGGLVGLYDDPDDKSFEHRLQRLFSFHYPDLLTQPMLSTLSAQRYTGSERKLLRKHLLPWTAITEKDIQKASEEPLLPIVCCSLAGGVIQIHRLDASLYALLLALQERLIASEVPLLLGSSKDFKEWYCQLSHGETNTIHGDLLVSFFRLSASEQNQLLSAKDDSIDLIEAVRTFLATMGPEGELVKPLGDFESWATVPMTVADAITVYEKIILELENNT